MIKTGNFGNDNGKRKEIVCLENQHRHICDYFAIVPAMQHSKMHTAELNKIYVRFTLVCSNPQVWQIPDVVLQRTTRKCS